MLKLKILLQKEQMEVADSQQVARWRAGTGGGSAERLWEVVLPRIRLSAAGPGRGGGLGMRNSLASKSSGLNGAG